MGAGTIPALVLAAGLGTRLRPLTEHVPKALVPIGDRTALAHAVFALKNAGFSNIIANAHHHADQVARACEELSIACSHEADILGTAGGLTRAKDILHARQPDPTDVLVWNADIFAPKLDPKSLLAEHERNRNVSEATLLVRAVSLNEGNVGWDEDGFVVRMRKESVANLGGKKAEIASAEFLGIHIVGANLPAIEKGCLVGDVYLPALRAGARLRVLCTDVETHDIGALAAYRAANRAWLRDRNVESFVAKSAHANADVSGSVIGENAVVNAEAKESVVWANAIVNQPIFQAIATPFGIF